LVAQLESPAGTAALLFSRVGGGNGPMTETVLSDAAETRIDEGQAPFTGAFRPATPLQAVSGESAQGVWRLRVIDSIAGETGALTALALQVNPCAADTEGEGDTGLEGEGMPDGEGEAGCTPHDADTGGDFAVTLSELLRVVQIFNVGVYRCSPPSEDGYAPGAGATDCARHDADFGPPAWAIDLTELVRMIQLFNALGGGYDCAVGTEDGFAPRVD